MTHTHSLTETYTHLPLRHWHTLVIVTDTHQHIDRGLYTYMTSYVAQAYRLSIIIDKTTRMPYTPRVQIRCECHHIDAFCRNKDTQGMYPVHTKFWWPCRDWIGWKLEIPIDSGMGLSITIDKLRVFINKTLSTQSLMNQLLIKRVGLSISIDSR